MWEVRWASGRLLCTYFRSVHELLINVRAPRTADATHTYQNACFFIMPRHQPISPTEAVSQAPGAWRLNTNEEVILSIEYDMLETSLGWCQCWIPCKRIDLHIAACVFVSSPKMTRQMLSERLRTSLALLAEQLYVHSKRQRVFTGMDVH